MTNIKARIEQLEQKIAVSTIPSFEDFSSSWATMDELSKSLLALYAETPDNADNVMERKYYSAIGEYLRRMGLVQDGAPSLREIAAQLEKAGD